MSKWKQRSKWRCQNEWTFKMTFFLFGENFGFLRCFGVFKNASLLLYHSLSSFLDLPPCHGCLKAIWWDLVAQIETRKREASTNASAGNCIWWSWGIYHIILVELSSRPKLKRRANQNQERIEIITKMLKLINKKLKFKQFIIIKNKCEKRQNSTIKIWKPS